MRIQRRVIDLVVGFGGTVTQVRILVQVRGDNARNGVPDGPVLGNQRQGAVLDLLENVGLAVGTMDFRVALVLQHGGVIPIDTELLPGVHQMLHGEVLGLGADIVVTGVVPTAVVQARNMLEGLEVGIGIFIVGKEVKVLVVGRCLQGIVQVRGTVPDPVGFAHFHMVHLHREEDIQGQLPGVLMHLIVDRERQRGLVAIGQLVKAGLGDIGEIEGQILVAQVVAPGLRGTLLDHLSIAAVLDPQQTRRTLGLSVGVQLNDGTLVLRRMIAQLGITDDRIPGPAGDAVDIQFPLGHHTGFAGGQQAAHHVPAVLGLVATVVEHQFALIAQVTDTYGAFGVFRRQYQVLPLSKGGGLGEAIFDDHRAGGVARESAGHAIGQVTLTEIGRRDKFHVQASLAFQSGGQRLIQQHSHQDFIALRFGHHGVFKVVLRVGQLGFHPLAVPNDPALDQLAHTIPLFGGGQQAHIAVGGGAFTVVDDFHTTGFGVEEQAAGWVGERQDVDAGAFEVITLVERQGVAAGLGRAGRDQRGGA